MGRAGRGRDQTRAKGRRAFAVRVGTLAALAAVVAIVLSACGDAHPYTTISPRTSAARDIQFLYKLIFWMALVVFVGIQFLIVYTALRYRRRSPDERPDQIHGNRRLEIMWTVIPAIVLLTIFIPTVRTMYRFDRESKSGDVHVEVYGKQWWWEVHYTDYKPNVVTANEIHVPVNKKIQFTLRSNNVIHSFWLPQMSGKMDVIPGHDNLLGFTPTQTGVYYGLCAEFCGTQHAWMRFKLIVQSQADYDTYIKALTQGPPPAAAQAAGVQDVSEAPSQFGLCLVCHRINGVNKTAGGPIQPQPLGLDAQAIEGPNLTYLGCRTTIAAGILANTPENLAKWLHDPGAVKPGNYMATQIQKGTLDQKTIDVLVKYLENQQYPGCKPNVPPPT